MHLRSQAVETIQETQPDDSQFPEAETVPGEPEAHRKASSEPPSHPIPVSPSPATPIHAPAENGDAVFWLQQMRFCTNIR